MTGRGAGSWPITGSQEGLLIADRLAPVGHLHNVVIEFELGDAFSTTDVRAALATLVTIQPALRLTFADRPRPHALLNAQPGRERIPVEISTSRADAIERLGHEPFDLRRGPLCRCAHVTGGDRDILMFAAHHVVIDGFSLRALATDLAEILRGAMDPVRTERLRLRRERAMLAELRAQVETASNEHALAAAELWADQLHDLPASRCLGAGPGRQIRWECTAKESAAIRHACRRLGVSAFVFFSAVYGAVLARYFREPRVVFGAPFMSRRTAGAYELCGFFVNTLPIAFEVDWSASFGAFAATTVRGAVDRTRARASISLGQLVQHLRNGRHPIFDCVLAVQDALPGSADGPVRSVREVSNDTVKFGLWYNVTPVRDRFLFEVRWNADLVSAESLVSSLRLATSRAIADPDSPMSDVGSNAYISGYGVR